VISPFEEPDEAGSGVECESGVTPLV
jgi:hypothetical protein